MNAVFKVTVIDKEAGVSTICYRKCRMFDSSTAKQEAENYFETVMQEVKASNADPKDFSTRVILEQLW